MGIANVAAKMENDGVINIEDVKAQKKKLPTVASFIPDAPEIVANHVIPRNYKIDPERGIIKVSTEKKTNSDGEKVDEETGKVICPHVILIEKIIEDPDGLEPEFCELVFYKVGASRWESQKIIIGTADMMFGEGLKVITSSKNAMGPKERQDLSEFFVQYMRVNEYLFDRYKLVNQLGYNKELGQFIPFTDEKLYPNAKNGTKIGKMIKTLMAPRSEEAPCRQLINELKDYPVWLTCFAGVLAAPVVAWSPQPENIGIDVHGKSRSGKTTIQRLASYAVLGNIGNITSWKSSSSAIFNLLPFCSSITFVMDDTHAIGYKNKDVPHAILNGDPRMISSEVSKAGGVKGHAVMDREKFYSVYLFNGEESIATYVTDKSNDSSGMYGRIISINETPFGDLQDIKKVTGWNATAEKHGGAFLHKWMKFLNGYDRENFEDELNEMFDQFAQENEFQRSIAVKASILLWALTKFGELFDFNFDIQSMIDLINKSGEEATDGVDRASKFVAALVKAAMNVIEFPDGDMKFGQTIFGIGSVPGKSGDQVVAVYKHGESLMIQNTLFEKVVDKYKSTPTSALEVLRGSGSLEKNKDNKEIANWSRPKSIVDTSDGPKIYGIKLNYEAIKGLISF